MEIPKYSKLELERKWLVNQNNIESVLTAPHQLIEDQYLNCGRLRLRRMTNSTTNKKIYKLCKKYGATSEISEPIVNIYLTPAEHAGLSSLASTKITKRRFRQAECNTQYSIDVFEGEHRGLVLCEVEAETEEALKSIRKPSFAILEVTGQHRFSGGHLSQLGSPQILELINVVKAEVKNA